MSNYHSSVNTVVLDLRLVLSADVQNTSQACIKRYLIKRRINIIVYNVNFRSESIFYRCNRLEPVGTESAI